jgi:hypothetical protein
MISVFMTGMAGTVQGLLKETQAHGPAVGMGSIPPP